MEDVILPISNVNYEEDIEKYFKTKNLMTMITCVSDLFMYGFNMSFQVSLMSCLKTTLTTRISDIFRNGFNVFFQSSLPLCLIFTLITRKNQINKPAQHLIPQPVQFHEEANQTFVGPLQIQEGVQVHDAPPDYYSTVDINNILAIPPENRNAFETRAAIRHLSMRKPSAPQPDQE